MVASLTLLLALGQTPGVTPEPVGMRPMVPMTYNEVRAYTHYLSSPYTVRAYSGPIPGYVEQLQTPFGTQVYFRRSGYLNEVTTPYGASTFEAVPVTRGYMVLPGMPYPSVTGGIIYSR
jgi:hypothetical protein